MGGLSLYVAICVLLGLRFRRTRDGESVFLPNTSFQASQQEATDPCSIHLYLVHHVVNALGGPDQCHYAFLLSF